MAKKKKSPKEKSPEQIVLDIQESCRMLGWNIAFDDREGGVRGLIVGQDEWVNDMVDQLKEDFSIYTSADSHRKDVH